jgi:Xaa-Pro aminopeptidase
LLLSIFCTQKILIHSQKLNIEDIRYSTEISEFFTQKKFNQVFIYDGIDSDSGLSPKIPEVSFFQPQQIDKRDLYTILNRLRTVKDEDEIEILRYICRVSSEAHVRVMKNTKPGLIENQMEALFRVTFCLFSFSSTFSKGQAQNTSLMIASARHIPTLQPSTMWIMIKLSKIAALYSMILVQK